MQDEIDCTEHGIEKEDFNWIMQKALIETIQGFAKKFEEQQETNRILFARIEKLEKGTPNV